MKKNPNYMSLFRYKKSGSEYLNKRRVISFILGTDRNLIDRIRYPMKLKNNNAHLKLRE